MAETDSTAAALPEGKNNLPSVILSKGTLSFLGDVGYSHFNEPFLHQGGFQVALQFSCKTSFSPSLYYISGSVSAQ
jgi:hypothetical protein